MVHLNGNILAVVDVETTGVDPTINDIIEVCVLPLDIDLKPLKKVPPFHCHMKPMRPENIDLDAIRTNRKQLDIFHKDNVVFDRNSVVQAQLSGIDPMRAADLLVEEWFPKLKLAPRRRIMPIAHNWPFDREFIMSWIGRASFELIFHPCYRDTMVCSLYENDKAELIHENFPYPKNNLQYLCSQLKVQRTQAHTALDDCLATAEVYRKIIRKHLYGSS